MNENLYQQHPKRLRSPLLEGSFKSKVLQPNNKTKKTIFNISDNNKDDLIDETLDKTLFCNKDNFNQLNNNPLLSIKYINSLEIAFKIACMFVWSCGGILCLLELINIIKNIHEGIFNYTNHVITLAIAFVLTLLANIICLGFIHLVKATKYIYLNIEKQSKSIEKILILYNQK